MNILFISIAWPRPGISNLYTDLMDEFVSRGHRVYVLGTQDTDMEERSCHSHENGIEVVRVHTGKIRKASYLRKIRSLLTLGGRFDRAIKQHYTDVAFDLILGPTPPITLSFLYKKLKKRFRVPFYLLLKDIWPQGSVDLKVFRKYSIPWLYFRSHEIRIYKTADFIGCMSPQGAKYLLEKNSKLPESKVEVCPNSIRPTDRKPGDAGQVIRKKYGIPEDACIFIFSGNLGVGHGLHFIAEAIRLLADYPKAYFVIGGAGTHYTYLKREMDEFNPPNAMIYSWLPRDDFEQILDTSDVGLIFLYRYTSPQFPSRLLSYLEYSKPALCAVNKETDIGAIVEESGCGRSLIHGDLDAFIAQVKYFSEHEEERKLMGEKGRELLLNQYTVAHSYQIIMKHFNEK
jgi:glycosyltransferase involved in cell wall biosynthesis